MSSCLLRILFKIPCRFNRVISLQEILVNPIPPFRFRKTTKIKSIKFTARFLSLDLEDHIRKIFSFIVNNIYNIEACLRSQ
jgi:hypothetical protein